MKKMFPITTIFTAIIFLMIMSLSTPAALAAPKMPPSVTPKIVALLPQSTAPKKLNYDLEKAKIQLHKVMNGLEKKLKTTRAKIEKLQKIQRMARAPRIHPNISYELVALIDQYLERTASIKNNITLAQNRESLKHSGDQIHQLIADIKGPRTLQIKNRLTPATKK